MVTPNVGGTGEAITALHVARGLESRGWEVHFLASELTARFLIGSFPNRVDRVGADASGCRRLWRELRHRVEPDLVVFADFPLLHFSEQLSWLAAAEQLDELAGEGAVVVTLDHLGMAQRGMTLYFAPPHLGPHSITMPSLPPSLKVLLPCPINEPRPVPGRMGLPFRAFGGANGGSTKNPAAVRSQHQVDAQDVLVFHSVSSWAIEAARRYRLPHYWYLSRLLKHYFEGSSRPVTVVSVNDGGLLEPVRSDRFEIKNLAPIATDEYSNLFLSSDLVITDNRVSVTLARAAEVGIPSVALRNSLSLPQLLATSTGWLRQHLLELERTRMGSVFPYEVFPIWDQEQIDKLAIFRQSTVESTFETLELFGGEATASRLQSLASEADAREHFRAGQQSYLRRLDSLPDAATLLESLV